jgi:WD40 repeat protein
VKHLGNSSILATSDSCGDIKVWDIRNSSKAIYSYTCDGNTGKGVAWSTRQFGVLICGSSEDGVIKKVNVMGSEKHGYGGDKKCDELGRASSRNPIWSLLPVGDRELIVGHGGSGNQVSLWDYADLMEKEVIHGHEGKVLHLAASPDLSVIVTGATDNKIKFWKCTINETGGNDFYATKTTLKDTQTIR